MPCARSHNRSRKQVELDCPVSKSLAAQHQQPVHHKQNSRPMHLQALGDVAVGARRVAAQVAFEQHAIRLVILHTRHEESVQAFKLEALRYKLVHYAY